MRKQKRSPILLLFIRTLVLAAAVVAALLLIGGALLLCEDPVAYAGVGASCAFLLVGFVFGLILSRESSFAFDLLSPLCLSLIMICIGLILSHGALSLSVTVNHLLFLLCFSLGRILPHKKRKRHKY